MATLYTLGLSEIQFNSSKVGMVYKDTCKLTQDDPTVNEHFEEGKAYPAVTTREGKPPKLTFSIMNPDAQFLSTHLGGTYDAPTKTWKFSGEEIPVSGEWDVITKKGMDFTIKKGDAVAKINFDVSDKSILLVDFTVTPTDPGDGSKPFEAKEKA